MMAGPGNPVETAPTSEKSRDVGVDAVLPAGTRGSAIYKRQILAPKL
jgi:hypothetical protein